MPSETLVLSYDVYSLPTAQHRAGLAGLLILCELLGNESETACLPEIRFEENGIFHFTWTPDSLRSILNYFYDAKLAEVSVKSKWSGQEPKDVRTRKTDDGKEEKVFIYDQLMPTAPFFQALGMPEVWIRLWFNALWQTLRAVPKTRTPYENRSAGKDALDIATLWKDLGSFQKDFAKGKFRTADIASCFFVGSQAHNAEMIPFKGRIDENFLLHFWPVVMGVYRPEMLKPDGSTPFQGYVLVVPDILDMEKFCLDFRDRDLTDYSQFRNSVISIHQEGILIYGNQLLAIARAKQQGAYRSSLCGAEAYHLEKRGNNVHMLASDRLELDERLLQQYEAIRDAAWNPLFKRQWILNLLSGKPWYTDFEKIFATRPCELFLGNGNAARLFSGDVNRKFKQLSQIFFNKER